MKYDRWNKRQFTIYIIMIIIGMLTSISCSVLIMNHSNGNIVKDETEPIVKTDIDADLNYKRIKKGLHIGSELNDTIR